MLLGLITKKLHDTARGRCCEMDAMRVEGNWKQAADRRLFVSFLVSSSSTLLPRARLVALMALVAGHTLSHVPSW